MTSTLLVPVDGPVQVVDWDLSELADPAGLVRLQQAVGGYIEAISGPGWHAYINEDGLMLRLPPNLRATRLAEQFGWVAGQPLVGTVVFLGSGSPNDGDDHDVPVPMVEYAARYRFSH